jgi:agmatine deiminase
LSRGERVEVIVKDSAAEKLARKILKRAHALNSNVGFHRWPTNRVWTRDSGCAFVFQEQSQSQNPHRVSAKSAETRMGHPQALAAIEWRFNAWAKYSNWKHDEKIGALMAKAADAREVRPEFNSTRVVLEGGSIDVNGCGTLITTEECLLSRVQQRNPGMKKRDYEQIFAEYLGATNVIWLDRGVVGDDTHGHVDDITRFVSPDTVVSCVEADPQGENYEALRENPASRLQLSICPCPRRFTSKAAACRQVTQISISQTAWFLFPSSTIRTIGSRSTSSRISSPIATWLEFIAATLSGVSAQSTA